MKAIYPINSLAIIVVLLSSPLLLAHSEPGQPESTAATAKTLVGRLSLQQYKATLKGLTQFGDRRQGTARNRAALDWIETQLQSYGCTNTARISFQYPPEAEPKKSRKSTPSVTPTKNLRTVTGGLVGRNGNGPGGSSVFGYRVATSVNRDLNAQADTRIRDLNSELPVDGERQQVYCTKIGTRFPDQMYIVAAHMDGHGVNEAVNDDGSGTALVMELARIFSAQDVQVDYSIRFILWNNEETGLNGSRAYVAQRQKLQGIEQPPGSGLYPEPRWLGMIQHDMMMWDHGAPNADGVVSADQRPEADVNIEFQSNSALAVQSSQLAFLFKASADRHNTDYPATIGPHMTNTDSTPFMNLVPSISLRENERGAQTGAGWNPTWHTPLDVWTTFSDQDFRLGLNAAQTTLGAVVQLSGASLKQTTQK